MAMRILMVNGSPRGEHGNTAYLTRAFIEGATEAGAQCETVYLKDKQINPCVGCFACWFKTPGVCAHSDDMPALLEKMQQSDLVVYATPLYVYTVTGIMKDFMDRIIPLVQPFVEIRDGLCMHPSRSGKSMAKSLLISNCGFSEQEHFAGLKETFRCLMRGHMRNAGMICCSAGPVLNIPEMKDAVQWYIDATRRAGREVVEQGRISDATQSVLERPLIEDNQAYADELNKTFRSFGAKPVGE